MCITYDLHNGVQKYEEFMGFKKACSKTKTGVVPTSLNYVQFFARCY